MQISSIKRVASFLTRTCSHSILCLVLCENIFIRNILILRQNRGLTPLEKGNFSTIQDGYFYSLESLVFCVEHAYILFYDLF